MLSILRVVVALLFLEHGMSRLLGFPSPLPTPHPLTVYWFAGAIEFAGGVLVLIGLFTRPAAFIMSGEMAFAYFTRHAPREFFPILNRGDAAILTASSSSISSSPGRGRGASMRCGGKVAVRCCSRMARSDIRRQGRELICDPRLRCAQCGLRLLLP